MKPWTLRALAALLAYPDGEFAAALPEIRAALAQDRALSGGVLDSLLAELTTLDPYAAEERYVSLFDRSRALSLHLFEHLHGESRDRGQAMVDLAEQYAARGFAVPARELPDYLPSFLEFLSLLPETEARDCLGDAAHVLRALGERLAARGSNYAEIFAALLELAGKPGLKPCAVASPPAEEDLAAVERNWMEPEVRFGGPQPVRLYRKGAAP